MFFFLIMILDIVPVHPVEAGSTTVSVSPSSMTASVGESFSINVTISNVFDLYGWEFKLSWNTNLLNATSETEGPFLRTEDATFFTVQVNETEGHMVVDCTLLGITPGVAGSGTLATVTFLVEDLGECVLDLYEVLLLDSFENSIQISQINDGYGCFSQPSAHDIAVIDLGFSPANVLPSEIVQINVTAQNQGSFLESFDILVYANSENVGTQHISLNSGSSTVIQFDWNTTDREKGDYALSASASAVPNETDTADNSKTAADVVTILFQGHDIAVVGVEPAKSAVGQNYSMSILVTVKNYDTFIETFTTRVYANATVIASQTITLPSGNTSQLVFTWNTTDFAYGNYAISAYAQPVLGETDIEDNTFVDGYVFVSIPGDVNSDQRVNILDAILLAIAFGSRPGAPSWSPNADINDDHRVNILDAIILSNHFGERDP